MKNLNSFFNDNVPSRGNISVSGKLEAYVGNYYVRENFWEKLMTIYYDNAAEKFNEEIKTTDKNIIAYMTLDYKYAFVLESMIKKFCEDTKEYNITYIPAENFIDQLFYVDDLTTLPDFMKNILWIDDDFLSDEKIKFDYEAFETIDSGVVYLNPKHFSVKELVNAVMNENEETSG